ncbi:MAG: tRNA (N(6)-L-threonylcarbamoyladenosine(37)-C(2))-methylthiotransferase MtaB [Elusimicrobia bacterium]|nr:tRNA (N(6)-L-threonylcarbamoyladenosine(37)-C(2))-methylthiotransferase MtaB [Elusimicrobiota bacterium]
MKVFLHTFGCRVNQYETEQLRERLLAGGGTSTGDFSTADVCVVNTCTVTRAADQDALRLIRRISRRNPAARLVVTGCLASRSPEEILAAAPHAIVRGNDGKREVAEALGCSTAPAAAGIRGFADRARAFVKVQDGCNMTCTYCIIPSVRPTLSSRPVEDVLAEVRGLIEGGYREVVLCGIRLGRYLAQHEGRRVDFNGLLERLLALPGDFRIRLSSFEITDVTDRFLGVAEESAGRLCPSFHLPLQSGSDAVLTRMERWYSAGFYEKRVLALKGRFPRAGLFTDVMVGFPGETEADFEATLSILERMGFCGLHIFPFSAREGTPAAKWEPVVVATVERRMARIRELDGRLRRAFAARAVGERRRVLVEGGADGAWGTAEDFLKIRLDRDPGPGFAWVTVGHAEADVAVGTIGPIDAAGRRTLARKQPFSYTA